MLLFGSSALPGCFMRGSAFLQVDLAAIATDNELRTAAGMRDATKADVDPVKTITTMAAVLGGKFFLLQVRLPVTLPQHACEAPSHTRPSMHACVCC
jgi:hypothetical protein